MPVDRVPLISQVQQDVVSADRRGVIGTARATGSGTFSGRLSSVSTTVPSATANTRAPKARQLALFVRIASECPTVRKEPYPIDDETLRYAAFPGHREHRPTMIRSVARYDVTR